MAPQPIKDSSPSKARRPAAQRTSRRERRRLETRERIYQSALQLFAERGFMETTVEDITEAADVGKGTFFNYFPTKEHVLATYGAERLATVQQALQRARTTKGPVFEVLRDLATSLAGHATQSPALLRAIYGAHASCTAVRVELQGRMETARRLLAQIVRLAQQRGEIRKDLSASVLARLIQLILHGVLCSWALHPEGSLQVSTQQIWDLLSASMRVRPAEGARVRR